MRKTEEKKPGGHYYGKEGYSKGVLIFLKPQIHNKLMKKAKQKGLTFQEYVRAKLK